MNINNRKILIFPEYHLTDFPPQIKMSQVDAYDALMIYKKFGFDIFIAGYVEVYAGNLYSSCLVIDDRNVFNIRKRYPYKDEKKIISAWNGANSPIDLSIGLSYLLLCHDFTMELTERKNIFVNQNIRHRYIQPFSSHFF